MANRKLCASAITFLHRRACLGPLFSFGFHPELNFLGANSVSSFHPGVTDKCRHRAGFPASSWDPSRTFCSEPAEKFVDRCWKCSMVASSTPFLSCQCCRSVQPVDPSVDYFQIFGLDKSYEIRDENLETKYKDWQKKLHPDLVHSKSEREKAYAAEQSARVIDAYRTLSKPLSRAHYVLQLEGVHVDEERTVSDPELLAEMMDIREAVEEANDSQALKQIQSQVQEKFENWCDSFRNAFKNHNFEDAITSIGRMRYYERAIEEIVKKL